MKANVPKVAQPNPSQEDSADEGSPMPALRNFSTNKMPLFKGGAKESKLAPRKLHSFEPVNDQIIPRKQSIQELDRQSILKCTADCLVEIVVVDDEPFNTLAIEKFLELGTYK